MNTIESTIRTPHLSGEIEVEDETLTQIADWVGSLDTTPRVSDEEFNIGAKDEINGRKVDVEYFDDCADVSIRDASDESVGALLTV